ncbi:DUF4186 domain-containing protein [Planctomycetota bacterium]|nr:DUF4186 domain-containing protein [Planctomycetota bacterium]
MQDLKTLFAALANSNFRSRFKLSEQDLHYIHTKGRPAIRAHAQDFLNKRLAPDNPHNDGKQTPMRGHPVFIAQHATACCCRSCLLKWHKIPKHQQLTPKQVAYLIQTIDLWIDKQVENYISSALPQTDKSSQNTNSQQLNPSNSTNHTPTLFDNLLQ